MHVSFVLYKRCWKGVDGVVGELDHKEVQDGATGSDASALTAVLHLCPGYDDTCQLSV